MSSSEPTILTAAEEQEFREVFNLVDKDRSGTIGREELAQLMKTLSIEATPQELTLMIDEIDVNRDGEIQFDEFVKVMSRKVQVSYSANQIKDAFKVFESGGPPGYLRMDTLARALKVYGSDKLSEEQCDELLQQLNTDSNGLFNYVEYVNMMMSD